MKMTFTTFECTGSKSTPDWTHGPGFHTQIPPFKVTCQRQQQRTAFRSSRGRHSGYLFFKKEKKRTGEGVTLEGLQQIVEYALDYGTVATCTVCMEATSCVNVEVFVI